MLRGFLVATSLLGATLGIGSLAGSARAHGGPPVTRRVAFHPSDPETLYAQATFGLVVSHDRGSTWSLVCEEAIGWQRSENPSIEATTDGAVVLGLSKGLYRTATFCGAELARDDLENVPIVDTDSDPGDASRLFAATSLGSIENRIYASADDGRTWIPTGGRFAVGALPEVVRVAPSMPTRLYVSGVRVESGESPRAAFIARSDDSGDSWDSFDIDLREAVTVTLGGVDPTDPQRLLAWRHYSDEPDVLMLSEDGGQRWDDVAAVSGDLAAVVFSPDGSRVWYGGTDKGLHLSVDGGRTWGPLYTELAVSCLAARDGELWVCADNYHDGFAVGVSTNGGESFEPRFQYRMLAGQIECAQGTPSAEVCPVAWRAIQALFGLDAGPTSDAGSGRPDASAPSDASSPLDGAMNADSGPRDEERGGGGCGCALAGREQENSASGGVWIWVGIAGWARASRARRRRGGPEEA